MHHVLIKVEAWIVPAMDLGVGERNVIRKDMLIFMLNVVKGSRILKPYVQSRPCKGPRGACAPRAHTL